MRGSPHLRLEGFEQGHQAHQVQVQHAGRPYTVPAVSWNALYPERSIDGTIFEPPEYFTILLHGVLFCKWNAL
jgi:hypothetical protein